MHEWRRRKDGVEPWIIRTKENAQIIGWGEFYDDPFDPGWAIELAYYFDPSVWGNGYATELFRAALDVADRNSTITEISAFAHPDNVPALNNSNSIVAFICSIPLNFAQRR